MNDPSSDNPRDFRRMAREMAAGRRPDVESLSREEVEQLLLELSVHQSELAAHNDELRQARAEQERAAQQYQSLFETAPVSYLILDDHGNIRRANRRARELLVEWRANPVGLGLCSCLHQEWVLDFHAQHQAVMHGAGPRRFETRLANGEHLYAECSAEGDGDSACRLALMDITERKRMEEELQQARRAAEEASRMKSDFLAVMSHEIRTPLNGVMGMLQLLERTPLEEKQKQYVETAQDSGKTLLELINDILEFSRIEAGKTGLREETFNPRRLFTGVADMFDPQARRKGVELKLHLDGGLPRVAQGDPHRLRQILFNLVGNAVKFTRQGEVAVEARAAVDEDVVLLECSVRDTGPGLPQDKLNAVFEPFTQFEGPFVRAHQGTGLGLAIVKRLAALMDGEVVVDSQPGNGSTFTVRVRLKPAQGTEESGEVEALDVSSLRPGREVRVLVAEDNKVNLVYAREALGSMGVRVRCAADGAEALKALEEEPFDLVLMDLEMPEVDGATAARTMRSANLPWGNSRIPVVALTAHALEGDRERVLDSHMDDYLAKPFQMDELQALLSRLLGETN
jgi:signal transduction histidine kinase/ActR/RegA family two-component response regulator